MKSASSSSGPSPMALEDKGMAVAACGGDDNDMSYFVPIKSPSPTSTTLTSIYAD